MKACFPTSIPPLYGGTTGRTTENRLRCHTRNIFLKYFLGLKSADRNELNAGSWAQKIASVVYEVNEAQKYTPNEILSDM